MQILKSNKILKLVVIYLLTLETHFIINLWTWLTTWEGCVSRSRGRWIVTTPSWLIAKRRPGSEDLSTEKDTLLLPRWSRSLARNVSRIVPTRASSSTCTESLTRSIWGALSLMSRSFTVIHALAEWYGSSAVSLPFKQDIIHNTDCRWIK